MKFVLICLTFLGVQDAFALSGNLVDAIRAHNLVATTEVSLVNPAESLILPLSPGIHQEFTSLCWSFATLSWLETRFLVLHPDVNDRKLSLSRAGMQRNNAEERSLRTYIFKTDTFVEGGTFLNARILIDKYGLIPQDMKPYQRETYIKDIKKKLDALDESQRKEELKSIIDDQFFAMPETVEYLGETMTPADLATKMIDGQKFFSYAFRSGAVGEWGAHPDPDALQGTQSWYVDPSMKEKIIRDSLKAGFPVEMTYAAHCILIYGADYDEKGKVVKYYLKDSYNFHSGKYTYTADPKKLHEQIWELGTADLR